MMEQLNKLIIPICAIIVLTLGNYYQGFSDSELATLESSIYAIGTGILGIISVVSVARKSKNKDNKNNKK